MNDFYLHGAVDVLASVSGNPDELEIWDYKGSSRVEDDPRHEKLHQFQMRVYAELYKQKVGKYPVRAVLCFLAEEKFDKMKVEINFDKVTTASSLTRRNFRRWPPSRRRRASRSSSSRRD
jgi:hypothetical protein